MKITMKLFLFILLLGTSSHASDKLKAGDWIKHRGRIYRGSTLVESFETKSEIVEIDNDNWATTLVTISAVGRANKTNRNTGYIASCEQVNNFMEECPGSDIEYITVPAGNFLTCKIESVDEGFNKVTVWLGSVPFGIVKAVRESSMGDVEQTLVDSNYTLDDDFCDK